MDKYIAINIGPIISTFEMARKPRELWAASYLFSYLMRCIYEEVKKVNNVTIISPEKPKETKNKIGIYPDRLFIKGEFSVKEVIKNARNTFCKNTGLDNRIIEQYFNLMSVTCEESSGSKAIGTLNQYLDVLELCNYAASCDAAETVRRLITKTNNSPLFYLETGDRNVFPYNINTLAEIATSQLSAINQEEWRRVRDSAREIEREAEKKRSEEVGQENVEDNPMSSIDIDEDSFYNQLSAIPDFSNNILSHHKYFCVIQADGDNVGKTVSHEKLTDDNLKKISEALVDFDVKASEKIRTFGGLPLYAGGDDLLFIAPVVGNDGSNIFNLLEQIESESFKGVFEAVKNSNLGITASLSFGISITYYKYPLYEAFESARTLLFDTAKQIPSKKALAWSFRKHSGGLYDASFSLTDSEFKEAFYELIHSTTKKIVVSVVSHKLRQAEDLVRIVMRDYNSNPDRLDALFEKILEFQHNSFFNSLKRIMPLLYKEVGEDKFISTLYSLLRTAKFINGEDLHNE